MIQSEGTGKHANKRTNLGTNKDMIKMAKINNEKHEEVYDNDDADDDVYNVDVGDDKYWKKEKISRFHKE